jgi:hypothetical protein
LLRRRPRAAYGRKAAPMDVRLVQLLASFIAARSHYALARLEFAMQHAGDPAPPVIDRLTEPSQRALLVQWPHLESQLQNALEFADSLDRAKRAPPASRNDSYRWLRQSLRELDQYARAIRWVITVTEDDAPS